jgi:hypothetical protein
VAAVIAIGVSRVRKDDGQEITDLGYELEK